VSEVLVIVGAGRMGLALGAALQASGTVDRMLFHGRALEPPWHPLFTPEDPAHPESAPAEYRMMPMPVPSDATVLILAVPDSAIAEVAWDVARAGPAPPACAALHISGALSTDPLAPLHSAGYATGSMHPLQTIANPLTGADRLAGCGFALAGEPAAVRAARRLIGALDGTAILVPPTLRPLYHAGAVTASNFLVTLAAAAAGMLRSAGVEGDDALRALLPLMRGTLANLEEVGLPGALTGPIVRGDTETVRMHLARLSGEARAVYCALGIETLRLAREAGLDERQAAALESMLASG
jgi:predicted short-subunit dehydrogenase-like oxidoreductase (DUF2520 family)